jgi:hypothetical protein
MHGVASVRRLDVAFASHAGATCRSTGRSDMSPFGHGRRLCDGEAIGSRALPGTAVAQATTQSNRGGRVR